MNERQRDLLAKAAGSLDAARGLVSLGHFGYAAARAYYSMFYASEALLLGEGLAFSKHSAVVSAIGAHFVKSGRVPARFHRELLQAMDVRHEADYEPRDFINREQAEARIASAAEFIEFVQHMLASAPSDAPEGAPQT